MRLSWPLVLATLFALAPVATAQDVDPAPVPEVDPLALQVHGFVSQGFLVTTDNNYLAESERGSFEFTEVGLNFTQPLSDELRVGVQLFARDLGPLGNYDVKADWFYLDYRFADWFGLRAGRVKLPFGLYNEVNDVDQARLPILLPQSVYPIQNRDFLLAQTGVELYGYLDLAAAGALDYRLYGGTIFLDADVAPGAAYELVAINIPYVAGARVLWETPLPGLRAGGSLQLIRLEADLLFDPAAFQPLVMDGDLPASFAGQVEVELPALMWVGSIEYAIDQLLFAAEYSRWHIDTGSSEPLLFPESDTTQERLYGMAAYRWNAWFESGVYYALYFRDVERRAGRAQQQHDLAATLRFDINPHWLVKLEVHGMRGTAALNAALNDGTPPSQLQRSWGLFVVKTTAYF
jgi:hypothetical protein